VRIFQAREARPRKITNEARKPQGVWRIRYLCHINIMTESAFAPHSNMMWNNTCPVDEINNNGGVIFLMLPFMCLIGYTLTDIYNNFLNRNKLVQPRNCHCECHCEIMIDNGVNDGNYVCDCDCDDCICDCDCDECQDQFLYPLEDNSEYDYKCGYICQDHPWLQCENNRFNTEQCNEQCNYQLQKYRYIIVRRNPSSYLSKLPIGSSPKLVESERLVLHKLNSKTRYYIYYVKTPIIKTDPLHRSNYKSEAYEMEERFDDLFESDLYRDVMQQFLEKYPA